MSIRLDIQPRRQASPNSCWWACMSMVFSYQGRPITFPWNLSPIFGSTGFSGSPMSPSSPFPRQQYPPFLHNDRQDTYDDYRNWSRDTILHPSEWYLRGVPMTRRGLQYLMELTPFAPLPDRPAFGRWTCQEVEDRIRRYGPFIFIGNWNGQGFHAILVIGRERSEDGIDEVIYIDPAMGMAIPVSIEHFNRKMSSISVQRGNPIYLPAAANRNRTVLDRRDS